MDNHVLVILSYERKNLSVIRAHNCIVAIKRSSPSLRKTSFLGQQWHFASIINKLLLWLRGISFCIYILFMTVIGILGIAVNIDRPFSVFPKYYCRYTQQEVMTMFFSLGYFWGTHTAVLCVCFETWVIYSAYNYWRGINSTKYYICPLACSYVEQVLAQTTIITT